MVAPGDSLDFQEAGTFTERIGPSLELANGAVDQLRNRPNQGEIVFGNIRQQEILIEESSYMIVFSREKNKVGLMNLFEWPEEEKEFEGYISKLKETEKLQKSNKRRKI